MTPQLLLEKSVEFFKQKNISTARLDGELLLTKALGFKDRVDLYLQFNKPLSGQEINLARSYVMRRGKGEPVAYILENKEFFKIDFFVNANVLIPRPETEILAEVVLEHYNQNRKGEPVSILDLGCGSGCIGLSLAKNIENSKITLVDISAGAIEVAKINADKHDLVLQSEFLNKNVEELDLNQRYFDYIVANPPYIAKEDQDVEENVKKYEPHQALYASEEGMWCIDKWAQKAKNWLAPKGLMIFEIGIHQEQKALEIFKNLNIFSEVKTIKDLSGIDRHILGVK